MNTNIRIYRSNLHYKSQEETRETSACTVTAAASHTSNEYGDPHSSNYLGQPIWLSAYWTSDSHNVSVPRSVTFQSLTPIMICPVCMASCVCNATSTFKGHRKKVEL